MKKYQIKNLVWMVKDELGTKFHVEQDDYFGTIATVLSLLKQKTDNARKNSEEFYKTLDRLEKDLIWLQKNYQISPRIKKKKRTPKGNENNQ